MEHPLHTISYVADIEGVLVIMAHVGPTDSACSTHDSDDVSEATYTPKTTCHVLDAENVSLGVSDTTCTLIITAN